MSRRNFLHFLGIIPMWAMIANFLDSNNDDTSKFINVDGWILKKEDLHDL